MRRGKNLPSLHFQMILFLICMEVLPSAWKIGLCIVCEFLYLWRLNESITFNET